MNPNKKYTKVMSNGRNIVIVTGLGLMLCFLMTPWYLIALLVYDYIL
jgi:hypothetical protein